MEERMMKNRIKALSFSAFCGITFVLATMLSNTVTAQVYDETYYSPSKNSRNNAQNYTGVQSYTDTTVQILSEDTVLVSLEGEPEVKNKTTRVVYSDDDYYDYAYTARLRRFYTPVVGVGYFDDYYTNMYWYT